ncbi:Tetratricopeptide repeat protein 9A [Thoreauomyces humboldtii]|nr:Tetratricopeptide repeat protein 9A [Thoreauomyces humboldtii]
MPADTINVKLAKGKEEKDKGNAQFKAGNVTEALRSYHTATLYLTGLDNAAMSAFVPGQALAEELKADIKETLKACYSNMAACYIKQSKFDKCISTCTKIIALDPANPKAHYRRGLSYLALNNADAALSDQKKAAELAPQDKGIREELGKAAAAVKEGEEKARAVFRGKLA